MGSSIMEKITITDNNYIEAVAQIKSDILSARSSIARRINAASMDLYMQIGKEISDRKLVEGYGKGVVEKLSVDLKSEFSEMGLSPRNLWDMKRFYERYSNADLKLRQSVAVLPWGHNLLIMRRTSTNDEALHYASKAVELGWSRDLLLNYIKADDYSLSAELPKTHNFNTALPIELSARADEILKSKYNLGFLGVTESIKELELEKKLIDKIKLFILELGAGFTFMGNQYRLEFNNKEYLIDMLFFNRELRSLVAIELKIGEFKPEYIGKMNFYLTLLDKQVKLADENPSIGVILCADRDRVDVEIALQDINKPIGVAEYQLQIPKEEIKQLIAEEMRGLYA